MLTTDSRSAEGQKSKIKEWAGPHPSQTPGRTPPCFVPASNVAGAPLRSLLCPHTAFSLCARLIISVPFSYTGLYFFQDVQFIYLRERASTVGGGAEEEKERENLKPTPC